MTALPIIEHLAAYGLTLCLEGDSLLAHPARLLTDELRGLIRENKPALVALLAANSEESSKPEAPETVVPEPVREFAGVPCELPHFREELPHPAPPDPLPALYREWFADFPEPSALVTLSPEQVREAIAAGVVSRDTARDFYLLAYKANGAAGLFTVPAAGFDGLRLAEWWASAGVPWTA